MFKAFEPLMLVRGFFVWGSGGGARMVPLLAKCSEATGPAPQDVERDSMR